MNLDLSRIHYPVTTLGPGNRIGIWFQGCSIRCDGCISADTWAAGKGRTTVDAVTESILRWITAADGITISGGEPFDQPNALLDLLGKLRPMHLGDILVYSGYSLERLQRWLDEADGLIDAIISDPYDIGAAQTLRLRGSDNQRLVPLTALGRKRFESYSLPTSTPDRALDVMFDADGIVWFAGIPRRNDFRRLQELLGTAGHKVSTAQALSRSRGRNQ